MTPSSATGFFRPKELWEDLFWANFLFVSDVRVNSGTKSPVSGSTSTDLSMTRGFLKLPIIDGRLTTRWRRSRCSGAPQWNVLVNSIAWQTTRDDQLEFYQAHVTVRRYRHGAKSGWPSTWRRPGSSDVTNKS